MHTNTNCFLTLVAAAVLLAGNSVFAQSEFHPGEVWSDTDGKPIQAHGGGILVHGNVYYWYGEDRTPGLHSAVSCYSSTNLYDWTREGVALWQTNLPAVNNRRTFVERPKVIYNPRTKKFVMWMHLEQNRYEYARAGIAVSDSPTGPFTFLKAIRPVANTNDFATLNPDPTGEKELGSMFRDMNVFVDDDGQAYVFYAGEDNWTMYVTRLNADFTGPQTPAVNGKTWARILIREHREAPAPFKWRGKYFLITSACTGWKPNAADVAVATSPLGPYRPLGNPCVGDGGETTFGCQSTFVLPVPGQSDHFIFMADRWSPRNLADSRHVWLPFDMRTDETFTIAWRDKWSLSAGSSREVPPASSGPSSKP